MPSTNIMPAAGSTQAQRPPLIDIEGELAFVERTIARAGLTTAAAGTLTAQIAQIRGRHRDRNLYLAVVGEFDSGKSTLINALLRDNLLKASSVVATAIATKIVHGSKLDITVHFKNARTALRYSTDFAQIWQQIVQRAPKAIDASTVAAWVSARAAHRHGSTSSFDDGDIRRCLQILTADATVANQVESMSLEHPVSFLSGDIVLIDTPGLNAEHAQHTRIAQEVVAQQADAAIVVIAAPRLVPETLLPFLRENLGPFLHRCIFVVTQMDKIAAEEQDDLLDYLQQRLRDTLKLTAPTIYAAAPLLVHRDPAQVTSPAAISLWRERFSAMETALGQHLRQQRTLSITENLIRLLNRLLDQLAQYVAGARDDVARRQVALKGAVIQDLQAFANAELAKGRDDLRAGTARAQAALGQVLARRSERITELLRTAIYEAQSIDVLSAVVQSRVKPIIDQEQSALNAEINAILQTLEREAAAGERKFDTRFTQEYTRLSALGGTSGTITQPTFAAVIDNAAALSAALHTSTDLSGQAGWRTGSGAVAGAIFGQLLIPIPGVGAFIGGILGSLVGGFFAPSLSSAQAKVWGVVAAGVTTSYGALLEEARAVLARQKQALDSRLKQRIDAHVSHYRSVVARLQNEQQAELDRLRHLEQLAQSDLEEIRVRQTSLERSAQQLSRRAA